MHKTTLLAGALLLSGATLTPSASAQGPSPSVTYEIKVTRARVQTGDRDPVFSTCVTMVRVDDEGKKLALKA